MQERYTMVRKSTLAIRIEKANELIRFCRERLRQTVETVLKLTAEE